MSYPEHEKLKLVRDKSQVIGEFIEWLGGKNYNICEYNDSHEAYLPATQRLEVWLAEFFEINLSALESEKQQMIEELRRPKGTKP